MRVPRYVTWCPQPFISQSGTRTGTSTVSGTLTGTSGVDGPVAETGSCPGPTCPALVGLNAADGSSNATRRAASAFKESLSPSGSLDAGSIEACSCCPKDVHAKQANKKASLCMLDDMQWDQLAYATN
mmetsp:Transcript_65643/g.117002  ORF Transcript_65643/g.117002 Transcript_65643/m.117002 type:complete len:128 (-) Transcript_65643:40-423(-)